MPSTKTKKRTSTSRSNGGGAKTRAKTSAKAKTARKKPARKQTARANSSRATSRSRTQSQSNASPKSESRNGSLTQKAKAPALAAGAMLLGLAGGATAARKTKRRGPSLPHPKVDLKRLPRPKNVSLPTSGGSTAAWVGEKAKGLGDAGHRLADVTEQVARIEKTFRKG